MPSLLFASRHCVLDPASGAAGATLDLLTLLASRGWECRVLCGAARDAGGPAMAEALAADGIEFEVRRPPGGGFAVLHTRPRGVPTAICAADSNQAGRDGRELLALFERFIAGWRPDLVLTYGGDSVARELIARAVAAGLPVVFALHNFAYHDADLFRGVRRVLVPSEFSKRYYARKLGLECVALPSPIDLVRCVAADASNRRFVTFVNPAPNKGAFVFARIAEELGSRRPDVPLLVVEGRGQASRLDQTGIDLRGHPNLFVMKNTPDPREVYAASRVLLMPSLWDESFGRVAAEAMLNGIPIVASDRGALPETVAGGGILLSIPAHYTPETQDVPTPEEAASWVEAILRLWDDPAYYDEASRRALESADRFRPERVAELHDAYFREMAAG